MKKKLNLKFTSFPSYKPLKEKINTPNKNKNKRNIVS